DTNWLGQVLDNIPAAEVDGFTMHAYGGTVTDFHGSYVALLNLMDSKGHTDKPVYMSEWNRYSPVGNASEEAISAQFCRDALLDVKNWNAGAGHHNIISMTWFVYDGSDGTGQWDGYSLEYWKTHGNAYGTSGDLYTAFEQTVDLRYPAGGVGTPQPLPPPTPAFTGSPV